jgi:hypothetical protein
MDPTLLQTITFTQFTALLFKAFAVVLSFLYLIYSVVIGRQTTVMNRTLQTTIGGMISFLALLQILLGVILVTLAIFIA